MKMVTADRPGMCESCHKLIAIGKELYLDKVGDRWVRYHVACAEGREEVEDRAYTIDPADTKPVPEFPITGYIQCVDCKRRIDYGEWGWRDVSQEPNKTLCVTCHTKLVPEALYNPELDVHDAPIEPERHDVDPASYALPKWWS